MTRSYQLLAIGDKLRKYTAQVYRSGVILQKYQITNAIVLDDFDLKQVNCDRIFQYSIALI